MKLLVFADSLAFYGPAGPLPADDERLWPNVVAARRSVSAELFARVGWTARDAYWSLTRDPRVWATLPEIEAMLLAVGSMDSLPSPLPTYLREGIRYLRPDRLRRAVRCGYRAVQPVVARAWPAGPVALPPALTVRYLDLIVSGVRSLRPGLPVVAVLPATHRAASYGFVHTGRRATTCAISSWAARGGVPVVDLARLTVSSGDDNPDGIHWGWRTHRRVADAFVRSLDSA